MHDREPLNRDRTHVALSNHVADKDELLTAMLEAVADEIEPPKPTLRPSMPFGRGRSRPVKRSCAIRGRPSRGEVFALTCPGACNDLNSVQDCALSAPRCRSSRCRGGCSAVLRRRRGERRLPSHRGEARGYGRVGTSDGGGGRPPRQLGSGTFVGLAGHRGTGDAAFLSLADGRTVLRLENFDIQNGPDSRLYVVPGAQQTDPGLDGAGVVRGVQSRIRGCDRAIARSVYPSSWRIASFTTEVADSATDASLSGSDGGSGPPIGRRR